MDPLTRTLQRVARRLALQQWVQYVVRGLFASACASVIWVLIARLFPLIGEPFWVCVGLFAAGYVVSTGLAVYRRPGLLDAAVAADRRMGLRERLTSSLELNGVEGPMVAALHADARRKLAGLDYKKHFPIAGSQHLRWVYVPLVCLGLAYMLMPELDLFGYKKRMLEAKAKEEAVTVAAERLEDAVKPLQREELEDATVLADVTAQVEELAKGLKENSLDEKQALARLTSLTDAIEERRNALAKDNPMPKLVGDPEELEVAKELAEALKEGKIGEALDKLEELQKKIADGSLSPEETEKLTEDLAKMAKMLGGSESELGKELAEALAKAGEAMKAGDAQGVKEALEGIEMSLDELKSVLEQLDAMDGVKGNLGTWAKGYFATGDSDMEGPGMGGAGMGRGNEVGELPDIQAGFQPTKMPGPLTKGKMLADILQRVAPTESEDSNVDFVSGAFVQVQQEAEKALTQQEIPRASKEFVRQYFGSLEPEKEQNPKP